MCCIFTCLGWFIDLAQRFWTFAMSCCIAAAITCMFLTGSISGVALGYNYSLAEYIDLKETNVSVYLKRGVFDDDVVDDMDWRRSGKHKAIDQGLLKEDNLITNDNVERRQAPRSGRRMDDSIFISDDHNRFEGGLMKLTVKPPDHTTTTATAYPNDRVLINPDYSVPESADQMKKLQAVINMRKMGSARYMTSSTRDYKMGSARYITSSIRGYRTTGTQLLDDDREPPGVQVDNEPLLPGGRRMSNEKPIFHPNDGSARAAVPHADIGRDPYWILPKIPPEYRVTYEYEDNIFTYPTPVTPRVGPLKPIRPPPPQTRKAPLRSPTTTTVATTENSFNEEMRNFQQNLMLETPPGNMGFRRMNEGKGRPDVPEDYDEEIKGLPVRRRRRNVMITSDDNSHNGKEMKKVDENSKNSAQKVTEDQTYKTGLINKIVSLINQYYNKIIKNTQADSVENTQADSVENTQADSVEKITNNHDSKLLTETIFINKLLKICRNKV